MLDDLTELRRRIHGLSDEELWRMVNVDSAQYRQAALDYAESELRERGFTSDRINANAETPAEGPYSAGWAEYRRRRKLYRLVWLTYIPGVLIIGLPLSWSFHSNAAFFAVVALWAVAFMAAANYLGFWKCPRCGKPFSRGRWYYNPFARECVHCGLPEWAASDAEQGP
jgi:hypothetical protein